MKKLLLLILVTLGYANYTAAIAGKYTPPPATTFPTTITGPVPSGGSVSSSPIAITITLDRTTSSTLALSSFTIPTANATLSGLTQKVTLTYSNQIGTLGTGNGNLTKPNDIAVAAGGKTYVTDGDNNRVEIFNSDGSYSEQFGTLGTGTGQFSSPYGIAVDAGGKIYVADAGNNRIQVFSSPGVYSSSIGTSGTISTGQLAAPQGIYIDPATNHLYVADSGNNRIAIFDLNSGGAYVGSIGGAGSGAGQFFSPSGVVVDANHFIYVTDLGNKRVVKFDASGNGVAIIGGSGNGNGQFLSPAGITTDGTGKIYVVDKSTKSRVQIFNAVNGNFLGVVGGTANSGNGNLSFPSGIAADKSGIIYVADRNNNRVETFAAKELYSANLVPTGNGPELITVSLASAVTDINGDQNATATYNVNYTATPGSPTNLLATSLDGSYELNWDANNPTDNVVGYNIYEGTSATNLSLLTSVDANTTTYNSDIPINNGTTLYFYVTAVTSTKESAPSNIVQVTPKGNPVISITGTISKTYGDADFNVEDLLQPHSASAGVFSYALATGSTGATISGKVITITGAGNATLVTSQAATNTYNAAVLNVPFSINKATPQINWSPATTMTYGTLLDASVFTATATKSGTTTPALAGTIAYTFGGVPIDGTTVLPTGDDMLQAAYTPASPDDANYNPTIKTVTVHVGKATPILTWNLDPSPGVYSYGQHFSTLPQPTVTDINGVAMTDGTFAYSFNPTVAAVPNDIFAVGSQVLTVTYTPSTADATNYGTAQLTKTIQIGKASQTITQNTTLSKTYGDAPFSIAGLASSDSGLPVSYSVAGATYDAATNMVTITGAGDITITASQAGDGNYNAATNLIITIPVTKSTPTITWALQTTDNYGLKSSDLVQPSAVGINNTALTGGTFTYSYNPTVAAAPNDIFAVGLQSLTAHYTPSAADAANYTNTAQLTKTIQIDQATQTITQNTTFAKTYGDAPFSIAGLASASSGLPVSYGYVSGPGTYDAATKTVTITGAGDIVVSVSQGGDGNYLPATPINITISVAKAIPTITWALQTSDHYGLKSGDLVQPSAVGINNTALTGGTFTYSYSPTVAAAPNDIFAVGLQSLTAHYTPSAADATNYGTAQLTKTIQIGKASQTITQNTTLSKTYGDAPFSIAGLASSDSGLPVSYSVAGATYDVATNMVTITGAGDITITASQAGDGNYNAATNLIITIPVTKSTPTITWALQTTDNYGLKSSDLVLPSAVGINNTALTGGTFTYSYSPTVAAAPNDIFSVGLQSLTVHYTPSAADAANYTNTAQLTKTIQIGKSNQSITVTGTIPNKATNAAPFDILSIPITATASSGLQVSYSIVSGPATINGTTITLTGAPGTVKVGFDQAGDNTYNAAEQKTLSFGVGKLDQSITVTGTIPNKAINTAPFDITTIPVTVTASSGLQVSYSIVSGPATINGTTITLTGAPGTVKVGFDQAGDNTYNAAEQKTLSFGVGKLDQTITVAGSIANKATNAAPFDILSIPIIATASSGLQVSYSIVSGPATINGTTITLTGAPGTVKVGFDQAGDNTYNAAEQKTLSFGVGKLDQSITVTGTIPNKAINAAPFDITTIPVTATASSGLQVSYSIVSGPATINGTTITLTGAQGTVTVGFNQGGNNDYSPALQKTLTFNVGKIEQQITASTVPTKTVGDAPFDVVAALNASTSSGLPISSYTLMSNSTGATLSGHILTITGAGTVHIAIKQDGNSSYNPTELDVQFDINPTNPTAVNQQITASTVPTKTVGDAPFDVVAALNASTSSGLPISSYTLMSNSTGATLSGHILTITGAGTVHIAIKQDGNSSYNPTELDVQFDINPTNPTAVNQQITASTIPTKTVGDAPFDVVAALNASTSSGLPISSYTLMSNSTGATLSGHILTITGAGTVHIAIKQDGNSSYNPTELDAQFDINPTNPTAVNQQITASTIPTKTVGDAPFDVVAALNASTSSGLPISSYTLMSNSTGATLSGHILTITGAGTVHIAIKQDGNSSYNPTELDAQFDINPTNPTAVNQQITASTIPTKTVGDAPFDVVAALNASTSSGLPISSYTLMSNSTGATLSGHILTITGAGTVHIAIKQDGNSSYNPTELDAQFDINPTNPTAVNQQITASTIPTKTVGDAPFDVVAALNASTSSGLPISSYTLMSNSTGATLSGHILTITGAGTVHIAIKQDGNSSYNPTELDVQFDINPTNPTAVNQQITASTVPTKTVGDAPFDVVAALNASTSSGLPISSYTLMSNSTGATLSGHILTITGAGTVHIAIKQDGNSSYNPTELDVQFDIVKANQTITVAGVIPDKLINSAAFDLAAIPVTATASSGLPVRYSIVSGPATISGTRISLTGGTGMVTVGFNQAGNSQYNAALQTTLTFNVNKLSQTIALTGFIPDKTYGDAPFNWKNIPVTAIASSGLPVVVTIASGPATISGDLISITGAGTVTVSFSQVGNSRYDAAENQTLTFKVNQLTPQVTWTNPTSITYGTALSKALQLYASSATPGTFTYSPAEGTVLHAGTQTLSVTFTPTDAVNYSTYTKTATLVVNKAAVNVSVSDVSRPYNQPNPDFAINYSGFVNGDTQANLATLPTASTTATTASLVGSYPITVSGAVSNDYTFRYINATLTINTTGRDLTFNQLPVKTYGDANFDAGAVASSGEPILYTSSNIAVATIVNGQIHIVGAGYVTITASLSVNSNYNTTPSISQFMVVNKATQTIDFVSIPVQFRGTTYDLSNIKSSSGLPVTFTTNDPMIASINGLTVSSLRVGITGIVANQAGDANYYPANTAVRNLEVKDVTREVIVHPAVSPNGDGINDVLYIEGINEHPANRVTIINRNGVRVYEINGYDNATKSFDGRSNFTGAKQQAGTYFYLVEYVVDGVGRHLTGYFVLKYD